MTDRNGTTNFSFGLLQEDSDRWGSFGTSAVINASIAVCLLLFVTAKATHDDARIKHVISWTAPDVPKPEAPVTHYVPPPAPVIKLIDTPRTPTIEAPPPAVAALPTPAPPPVLPVAQTRAVAAPVVAKTGLFDSQKAASAQPARQQVQTAGFTTQTGQSNMPKQQIQGAGFGSAVTPTASGPRGQVSGGGFGNAIGAAHAGPKGTVGSADFGTKTAEATVAKAKVDDFVAPVVQFTPRAEYTAEAQAARIEGVVTLKVNLLASGQVQVLGVVSGLGHGLDEAARRVAESIRFKPAMKNGQPVDHVTLIHITFQLA